MLPPTTRSTLFPYTTLFRSRVNEVLNDAHLHRGRQALAGARVQGRQVTAIGQDLLFVGKDTLRQPTQHMGSARTDRSEEHTSELQSRGHLVCRLLLEKKKHS